VCCPTDGHDIAVSPTERRERHDRTAAESSGSGSAGSPRHGNRRTGRRWRMAGAARAGTWIDRLSVPAQARSRRGGGRRTEAHRGRASEGWPGVVQSSPKRALLIEKVAPAVGLEPTTKRLTAARVPARLPGSISHQVSHARGPSPSSGRFRAAADAIHCPRPAAMPVARSPALAFGPVPGPGRRD